MNISNIKYFCTVNGLGVRTAIFVSGCCFHCKGCFNREAWSYDNGVDFSDALKEKVLKSIEPEYIEGLSILGGEPLDPLNRREVLCFIKEFRKKFGNTKDIWLYTGYELEDALKNDVRREIIKNCDYIVDGLFELDKADTKLAFRGSSNQNIYHNKNGKFEIVNLDQA